MKRSTKILLILYGFIIACYLLFMWVRPLADVYVKFVFRPLSQLWMRFSDLIPFSLGEWYVVIGLGAIVVGLLVSLVLIVFKKIRLRGLKFFGKCLAWFVLITLWLLNFHWFALYRATPVLKNYLTVSDRSDELLVGILEEISREVEELEPQIQRDENGYFRFSTDFEKDIPAAMEALSSEFSEFSGYYPDVKKIYFSFYMSQTGTLGIYLPMFEEANINDHLVDAHRPYSYCHELTHTRGIIQEDEANFFGLMAAINSDNPDIRYSGYLGIMEYLHGLMYDVDESYWGRVDEAEYVFWYTINNDIYRYHEDNYWEEHEDEVIVPTEIVNEVQNTVYDATLVMQGVEDGRKSYDRVVEALLDYFAEHGTLKIKKE
ncbi:MAG: DUF3810 domain-containing protein [Lachnospiraceae bacterium]|nr:DUF3810 domain-containing protein [Lachnospiraceae bacterium]